jgi:AcrR family transcriptional regulator
MIGSVKTSMRDRLVDAATELFYAEGLRAVSVDKVIERAGTTKVTFYRQFKSKDDLVVAHLELRAQQERDAVTGAMEAGGGDPDRVFQLLAGGLGALACEQGFRGCPFINAAAEYPDPESSVRKTVDTHRTWWREAFRSIVEPWKLEDPSGVADDLMLIRDGAMVAGYLDDPERVASSFLRSARALTGPH